MPVRVIPVRAFIVTCVLLLIPGAAIADDPIQYDRPRELGKLSNPAVEKSSGLAIGWENDDVLWTINSDDKQPMLFAMNKEGTHQGEFYLEGEAIDWEDMASFRMERDNGIVIADIGDERRDRKSYTLYMLEEPELRKVKLGKRIELRAKEYKFTYESGPQHCASIGVDVKTGVILFVTQSSEPTATVFELKMPDRRTRGELTAKKVATIGIPTVTAMDISPDGTRAVLLTYGDAYEYTRGSDQTWAEALKGKPRIIRMPHRRKGESICFGQDGKTLYLTTKGRPTSVWEVPVRE